MPPAPPQDLELIGGQVAVVRGGRARNPFRPFPVTSSHAPGGDENLHAFIVRSSEHVADLIRGKVPMEIDSPFDPALMGLKEIGNLASWTVSSCKPGCGVDALRDDDTGLFWQ